MRSADLKDAHVGHVEQPSRFADGVVLVQDAGVPDRHLPASKGNDLAGMGLVPVEKRRALEGGILLLGPLERRPAGVGAHRVQVAAAHEIGHPQFKAILVPGPVEFQSTGPPRVGAIAAVLTIVGQPHLGAQRLARLGAGGRGPSREQAVVGSLYLGNRQGQLNALVAVAEQIARHLPRLLQDLGRLGAAQGQGHKAAGLLRLAQVLDDQGAFHLAENVIRVKEGVAIAHSPEPCLDPLVVLGVGAQQVAIPLQRIVPLRRQPQDRDIVNQPAIPIEQEGELAHARRQSAHIAGQDLLQRGLGPLADHQQQATIAQGKEGRAIPSRG